MKEYLTLKIYIFIVCLLLPGKGIFAKERVPFQVGRAINTAHVFIDKDQIAEAIDHLASFIKKGNDHYMVFFALGNCYMLDNRFSEAKETYLLAVKQSSDYTPAWFNLAKSYFELKEYGKAGEMFAEAYDRSTEKKAKTLYYAGASFLSGDQPEAALQVFQKLIKFHNEEITLNWKTTLVHILLTLKRPRDALPVIEELSEKFEGQNKKKWQETRLYQYLDLDLNKRALEYAEQLTREGPLEPKWWKGLMHLHLMENNNMDALVALTVYGNLVKLSIEEKQLMADLSMVLDIPIRSIALLENILSQTWDSEALKKLAHSFIALNRPEDALKWVEEGLTRDSKNKDFLKLKGNLLFMMESYKDAQNAFTALLDEDPTLGDVWLMLGYAAWNAEDLRAAYQSMTKAETFAAQKKPAQEALRKLEKMIK